MLLVVTGSGVFVSNAGRAEMLQWTAIDVYGSPPESRLDFATCALQLKLVSESETQARSVSCLAQMNCQSTASQHSGHTRAVAVNQRSHCIQLQPSTQVTFS